MKFLKRWLSLRYRLRARHWQARALKAEKRVEVLERMMNAEVWRNREREDIFASAAVMGTRNMYGVKPRSGPAVGPPTPTAQPQTQQQQSYDPFDRLPWAEKQEYFMFYLPDGTNAGYSEQQIKERFMNDIASRKTLNDEIAQ